ncbi:hypothetical protein SMB554_09245 [Sinorhizobium meliloti]|nr:hypothetical protein SMB554_09245 [Sinorhizobium meliloti]
MTITAELVVFIITIFGAVSGVWWRVESKVKAAEDKADRAAADLAQHRVHSAETFATKAGLQESTAQLLRAIEGVGNRIDGVHERLDRVFESRTSGRRTST